MTPTSPTGVILAAGQGRRMGRIGLDRAKPCLPVGNRPLLHHHLDLFAQMQLETAVIVVGFRAEAVVAVANAHPAVRSGSIQLRFVEQGDITRFHVTPLIGSVSAAYLAPPERSPRV